MLQEIKTEGMGKRKEHRKQGQKVSNSTPVGSVTLDKSPPLSEP